METIRGIVTRVLRRDEESGSLFASIRYETPTGMVEGKLSARARDLGLGDFFVAEGLWKPSSYKGKTEEIFGAKTARPDLPTTKEGALRWFLSIFDARHGVDTASAKAFVDRHGPTSALLCDKNPDLLPSISKSPQTYRNAILQEWGRRVSGRRAVRLMESSGLPPKVISSILEAFRDNAHEVLNANPYRAAQVKDVGFGNADRIGRKIGIDDRDARRVGAALIETLEEVRRGGHTYADLDNVGSRMSDAFEIPLDTAADFIVGHRASRDAGFRIDELKGTFVAQLASLHDGEAAISRSVVGMIANGRRHPAIKAGPIVARLFEQEKYKKFDEIQRAAVLMSATEPFSILTGGPGTGKSTVAEVVLAAAAQLDSGPILPCAPTGKAAKRLEETTGRKAETIHRLLEAREDKATNTTVFMRNRSKPLPPGCLVLVDEASMIDVPTMRALMEAMPPDGRLILVGDRNQLPSVDAGAVLADLMASGPVPCTELVNVYRQSRDSRIATGAAQIREGDLPFLTQEFNGGVVMFEHEGEEITKRVLWAVEKACIGKMGYKPHQIAVLTPQNPSTAGAWELNRVLSKALNPAGRAIEGVARLPNEESAQPIPRVGDRVMLTENDTENDVMNGDIGTIVDAYPKKTPSGADRNFIKVEFDCGKAVEFPAARWRSLVLAYAITIHKSQGSQYPCVIMPVTMAHANMLDRSLLYTGWTRAKNALFIVGEREALEVSVQKTDASKRDTRLREFVLAEARRLGLVRPEPKAEAIAPVGIKPPRVPRLPPRPGTVAAIPAPRPQPTLPVQTSAPRPHPIPPPRRPPPPPTLGGSRTPSP